jgi:hypothetical protein
MNDKNGELDVTEREEMDIPIENMYEHIRQTAIAQR